MHSNVGFPNLFEITCCAYIAEVETLDAIPRGKRQLKRHRKARAPDFLEDGVCICGAKPQSRFALT